MTATAIETRTDPTACCLPRWAAAVRRQMITPKESYNVSGGNYFRKNADGSDGDDAQLYKKQQDDDPGFDVIQTIMRLCVTLRYV